MAENPTAGDLRVDWHVVSVFDPEREAPDFSYTVGLHARGLPELHLWAGPSHGQDPGADWRLSVQDRGALLNRLARQLITGHLAPGHEWSEQADFGLATLTFTVAGPVAPETVQAWQVDPQAAVLPVRYALHRAPVGGQGGHGADPEAVASWAGALRAGAGTLPRAQAAQVARALPDPAADVEFGPAGQVLGVLRAIVRGADAGQVADMAQLAMTVQTSAGIGPGHALGAAQAYARACGRSAQVEAAARAGLADAAALLASAPVQGALAALMGEDENEPDPAGMQAVSNLLSHVLAGAYACAASVDVLPERVLATGLAAVLTGALGGRLRRLWFDPGTVEAVRAQMGELTPAAVRELVALVEADLDASEAVQAEALLSFADAPPAGRLLEGTATLGAVEEFAAGDPVASASALAALEDVARALAHPSLPAAQELLGALTLALAAS